MEKIFCADCLEFVDSEIKVAEVETVINKCKIKYNKTRAYCLNCGEELYSDEIEDLNLVKRCEAYAVQKGLITVARINELLAFYEMTASSLSRLLKWSPVTITRYIEGGFPSSQNSEILESLFVPSVFISLVEKNKNKISAKQYDKYIAIANKKLSKNNFVMSYGLNSSSVIFENKSKLFDRKIAIFA